MARPHTPALLASASLIAGLLLAPLAVWAQDSFGSAPAVEAKQAPPRIAQPKAAQNNFDAAPTGVGEQQDFGIAPTNRLQPTARLHSPTPTSIPGGKVVGTAQLAQWIQGQQGRQGRVMLLHAIGSNEHLPNAIPVVPASQGGDFNDQVQREFGRYLEQATGGDRARLIVTYCAGVQCWGSYNAALRAIHMGYRNVHWYRGGMDAWRAAGLPLKLGNEPQ